MMSTIQWADFQRVDMRVGTILKAESFVKATKPAYKLWIDFGTDIGVLKSSAQITKHYTLEELVGIQIIAVVNFPKKQIADFMSECLVTGFEDENGDIILSTLTGVVPNGQRLC